jgi:hypothetical protein
MTTCGHRITPVDINNDLHMIRNAAITSLVFCKESSSTSLRISGRLGR